MSLQVNKLATSDVGVSQLSQTKKDDVDKDKKSNDEENKMAYIRHNFLKEVNWCHG